MAAYLSALLVCMKPLNLLLIFAMVALGIVFGAIPGLSATLGIALLLPITFGLSTETSFVMLLAIWIGGRVRYLYLGGAHRHPRFFLCHCHLL